MSDDPYTALIAIHLSVCWGLLSHQSYKNPCYAVAFPTKESLSDFLNAAGLIFCGGLAHVLDSSAPPSVTWLVSVRISAVKDHKLAPNKSWGIYLHVGISMRCRLVHGAVSTCRGMYSIRLRGNATRGASGFQRLFMRSIKHHVQPHELHVFHRSVICNHHSRLERLVW